MFGCYFCVSTEHNYTECPFAGEICTRCEEIRERKGNGESTTKCVVLERCVCNGRSHIAKNCETFHNALAGVFNRLDRKEMDIADQACLDWLQHLDGSAEHISEAAIAAQQPLPEFGSNSQFPPPRHAQQPLQEPGSESELLPPSTPQKLSPPS